MNKLSLTFVGLLLLPTCGWGREQLQIQYIDGTVCVQAVIRHGSETLNAHWIVELGLDDGFVIHRDAVELLGLEGNRSVTLDFGNGSQIHLEGTAADTGELDLFSRTHAEMLGEIPVWGYLGLNAFDAPTVLLDIQNQVLEYGELEIPEGHCIPLRTVAKRWLADIEPDSGYRVPAMIATGRYESVFDADTAALAGSENGDFNNCQFGGLNVRAYTAIRVKDGFSGHLMNADCLIANSFWQNFIVYWDIPNHRLTLIDQPGGLLSDVTEQAYYNAYAEGSPEAIQQSLATYPHSRLAQEARHILLDMAIESADPALISDATARFVDHLSPPQAAEALLIYAQQELEQNNLQTAERFLENAKTQVLKTEDTPLLRGRIDAHRGWIALKKKEFHLARKRLLSALFVNSDDVLTNYLMGRYHQLHHEPVRAWSRYLKASLGEEPNEQALEQLRFLDGDGAFRREFTAEDACDFLEGHIFDEHGNLTPSALRLKMRGGRLIRSAIDQLQERRR